MTDQHSHADGSRECRPRFRAHTVTRAVNAAVTAFGIPRADILSPSRYKRHARARQAVYLIAAEPRVCSFAEIGRRLSRDHSTVIYGARKARSLIQADPDFAFKVDAMRREMRA